jgi:hypothetical protein
MDLELLVVVHYGINISSKQGKKNNLLQYQTVKLAHILFIKHSNRNHSYLRSAYRTIGNHFRLEDELLTGTSWGHWEVSSSKHQDREILFNKED